jgi:hypothetical protein
MEQLQRGHYHGAVSTPEGGLVMRAITRRAESLRDIDVNNVLWGVFWFVLLVVGLTLVTYR